MNKIGIMIFLFALLSCNSKTKDVELKPTSANVIVTNTHDSLLMVQDSLVNKISFLVDSIKGENLKLKKQNDSLKSKIFLYKFTISRVRYRIRIVDKNPSQIKYLKGWIRRIVDVE